MQAETRFVRMCRSGCATPCQRNAMGRLDLVAIDTARVLAGGESDGHRMAASALVADRADTPELAQLAVFAVNERRRRRRECVPCSGTNLDAAPAYRSIARFGGIASATLWQTQIANVALAKRRLVRVDGEVGGEAVMHDLTTAGGVRMQRTAQSSSLRRIDA